MNRRQFVSAMAAATTMATVPSSFASSTALTHKERVDRALRGEDVDRPPFSLWHHYKRPTAQSWKRRIIWNSIADTIPILSK